MQPEHDSQGPIEGWQERFEALYKHLPVGVTHLTKDLRFIGINPFLEEKTGLKSHEIKGRYCYDVIGMYRADRVRTGEQRICEPCVVKAALKTGAPFTAIREISGGLAVKNTGIPLIGPDGKITGAIKISEDITGRKNLAGACEDATREREMEEEQEEFLAMLTHDLKTPLASIIGYSSLILGGEVGPVEEQFTHSVEGIRVNAQRMLGLVKDFLSAGRIKERTLKVDKKPVDMEALIKGALTSMTPQLRDKALQTDMVFEPGLPPALADKEGLERVICNLIANAVKFTPYDGRISFNVKKSDGCVEVRLKDTGIGISQEELPFLFDKYYQGKHGIGSRGSGLGLFIARAIVAAHDGTIEAESVKGGGATFIVRIPAAQ